MSNDTPTQVAPTKIKLSILVEVEYEPQPEHYDPGATLSDMLAVDLEGAKEDPFLQIGSIHAKWTITGSLT